MFLRLPDLEESTAMFGRLAESNAMAQILYGLALRFVPEKLPPYAHIVKQLIPLLS